MIYELYFFLFKFYKIIYYICEYTHTLQNMYVYVCVIIRRVYGNTIDYKIGLSARALKYLIKRFFYLRLQSYN